MIIVGSMLAVTNFLIGVVIFRTSDVVENRQKAKAQMWACVWGMLLLVSLVLLHKTVQNQPKPPLVNIPMNPIALVIGAAVSLGLYRLRHARRSIYGFIEIVVDLTTVWFAASNLQAGIVTVGLGILWGIYIVVRGLDNFEQSISDEMRDRWNRLLGHRKMK